MHHLQVFLDPEGSLSATTVVLVVLLLLTGDVVTRFRKMPKALLISNGKSRNFAYTFATSLRQICFLVFLPDGATFRICSTFRTCLIEISLLLSRLNHLVGCPSSCLILPILRGVYGILFSLVET